MCLPTSCLKHKSVNLCLVWYSIMTVIKCCHLVSCFGNIFFKLCAAIPMHGMYWLWKRVNSNFSCHRRGTGCFVLSTRLHWRGRHMHVSSFLFLKLLLVQVSAHAAYRNALYMCERQDGGWKSDAKRVTGCSTYGADFFLIIIFFLLTPTL